MSDLAALADSLGMAWSTLGVDERDRLLVVETLRPGWSRQEKVQYTLCGTPEIEFPAPPKWRIFKMVARTPSPQELEAFRALKVRRLVLELGFHGAAHLPSHRETFDAIGELLVDCYSRPLSRVTERNVAAVRKLVAKLPPTTEVTRFLRKTEKGVAQKVI
jgi:hypothetical protein